MVSAYPTVGQLLSGQIQPQTGRCATRQHLSERHCVAAFIPLPSDHSSAAAASFPAPLYQQPLHYFQVAPLTCKVQSCCACSISTLQQQVRHFQSPVERRTVCLLAQKPRSEDQKVWWLFCRALQSSCAKTRPEGKRVFFCPSEGSSVPCSVCCALRLASSPSRFLRTWFCLLCPEAGF